MRLSFPGNDRSGQTTGESLGVKARSFNHFKMTDMIKDDNVTQNQACSNKIPKVNFRY